jgi:hypothetical protein
MGALHRAKIKDVEVKRMLSAIVNPNRYCSKAAEAFSQEILPHFSTRTELYDLTKLYQDPDRLREIVAQSADS